MILFFDTNILLDVLAEREPHYSAAARLWSMAENGTVRGLISAISFNNVYYILRKAAGKKKAREALRLLRDVFELVALDGPTVHHAIDSTIDDFEDAIQYTSATRARATHLLTRDPDDFPTDGIPVLSAEELVAVLDSATQ